MLLIFILNIIQMYNLWVFSVPPLNFVSPSECLLATPKPGPGQWLNVNNLSNITQFGAWTWGWVSNLLHVAKLLCNCNFLICERAVIVAAQGRVVQTEEVGCITWASNCCCPKPSQTGWLQIKNYYFRVWGVRNTKGILLSSNQGVSTQFPLQNHFLAFCHIWKKPTFLGSWLLPWSSS